MHKHFQTEIFTIGHSNHPWPKFAALLSLAKIEVLIDVRTYPRSRFAQFGEKQLQKGLDSFGVTYLYLGKDLGGRGPDAEPIDLGTVGRAVGFQEAIEHVVKIASIQTTVLMCSEHEPLDCHRFSLLANHLVSTQISVRHILRCGDIEEHAQTQLRHERGTKRKKHTKI